ncbi:AMP-binding protein [Paenibacillus sp. FJAT-26967]|uniref:AMP-binding protein n=1 Tax=Paenibacillus sp. FJAT-26967 TaxID=1729690 RepID=UPI0008386C55|nr:class I adenylate-forming enzyme family protein [Paenibacillus sp. FJAT-26967]
MAAWDEQHLFYLDHRNQQEITYRDFIKCLNEMSEYRSTVYVDRANPYLFFCELIIALLNGSDVQIMDAEQRGTAAEEPSFQSRVQLREPQEIVLLLREHANASVHMLTSGTSGKPKRITHSIRTLLPHRSKKKRDVWAFAYHPSHFAGIQVFFEIVSNLDTLIYFFDYRELPLDELLTGREITIISATPTFYRSLLPYLHGTYGKVRRIIFGGEKYEESLANKLKILFPDALLKNIYATTETGKLLESQTDLFTIPPAMQGLLKIENDELLIHESLLREGPDSRLISQGWYYSGDLIQFETEDEFKFVSRKGDVVKVGGYKINLQIIEEKVKTLDGIDHIRIYCRPNSVVGNMLTAEIVTDKYSEVQIKQLCRSELGLESWEIPRVIYLVKDIAQTITGKKLRN